MAWGSKRPCIGPIEVLILDNPCGGWKMSGTSRWYCCRRCQYTRHRNSARCIVRATNVSAIDVPTFVNDADISSWAESAVGAAILTVRSKFRSNSSSSRKGYSRHCSLHIGLLHNVTRFSLIFISLSQFHCLLVEGSTGSRYSGSTGSQFPEDPLHIYHLSALDNIVSIIFV
jgi:hypothetical protein